MEVLCLGLSRTSTMSLKTALDKLGYKSYHFAEAAMNTAKRGDLLYWIEALKAKIYGTGKPYGPAEFEKLLQNYSAVTDAPCVNFSDELIKTYPNAKVVLTTRDPEPWIKSIETSYYTILSWRIWPFIKYINPDGLGTIHDCMQLILTDWTSPSPWTSRPALQSRLAEHNAHIRSTVPKDNLLDFRVQDGWEPLCAFLDKPIPNEPFPYVNKGSYSPNIIKVGIAVKLIKMSFQPLMVLLVAGLAYRWGLFGLRPS